MQVTCPKELALIAALQDGLPIKPRPYAALGRSIGLAEDDVIAAIKALIERGVIRRFGVIVRHRALGIRANGMVVWDLPDEQVAEAGQRLAALPYVTLCYRRPRRPPDWPYSLFCMIHGTDRGTVLAQVTEAAHHCGLEDVPRDVLFSVRCFKQRGARYLPGAAA